MEEEVYTILGPRQADCAYDCEDRAEDYEWSSSTLMVFAGVAENADVRLNKSS